jgi:hypothetical protein
MVQLKYGAHGTMIAHLSSRPYHNLLCVCCAPLLFCYAHTHMHTKKMANPGILGIAGKVFSRQTKLLHLIKVNL